MNHLQFFFLKKGREAPRMVPPFSLVNEIVGDSVYQSRDT